MSCKCASGKNEFSGELAIHFPGWEGLEKPIVWAFPKLKVCLECGSGEFALAEEPLQQLRKGSTSQSLGSASGE